MATAKKTAGRRPEPRTERIALRVGPALKRAAQAAADAERRTLSQWIEMTIRAALARRRRVRR